VHDTVSHKTLIREARREILKLRCPLGMRSDVWDQQQRFLTVLAGYLPSVWPSQRRLARQLRCSQSAIDRRVSTARRFNLVVTFERPLEGGLRSGLEYRLTCLSEGLQAEIVRVLTRPGSRPGSGSEVSPSSSKKDRNTPHSSSGAPRDRRSRGPETREEARMPRWDPEEDWRGVRVEGADLEAPLQVRSVRPADPAVRLAQYFDDGWVRVLRSRPDLKGVRASSRGMAIGYGRNTLLPQLSEEHAEAYIDAFMDAVIDGEVEFKENQIAYMRFTWWWGRQWVDDPVAARERSEAAARKLADWQARGRPSKPNLLDQFQAETTEGLTDS
jgi:hypothetical protein